MRAAKCDATTPGLPPLFSQPITPPSASPFSLFFFFLYWCGELGASPSGLSPPMGRPGRGRNIYSRFFLSLLFFFSSRPWKRWRSFKTPVPLPPPFGLDCSRALFLLPVRKSRGLPASLPPLFQPFSTPPGATLLSHFFFFFLFSLPPRGVNKN